MIIVFIIVEPVADLDPIIFGVAKLPLLSDSSILKTLFASKHGLAIIGISIGLLIHRFIGITLVSNLILGGAISRSMPLSSPMDRGLVEIALIRYLFPIVKFCGNVIFMVPP
ncbi:hypothetical protein SDC9_122017 [bioreactor metagenome]|uniref:Uncharacterized protein n=1 Tax=bioreactor metagenome TaxID=1076179 RepID=A0A645CDH0_9ZZZZ